MKCIQKLFFIFTVFGLTACASNPVDDQYYSLLLTAGTVKTPVLDEQTVARLVIGPIQLADYLNQPGLPIQIGTNQIRMAAHNFWAEPLDEAIGKVLAQDISQRLDSVSVERDAGRWTLDGDCQLRVEFDSFHTTNNSQVITRGRYWLHERSSGQAAKREFNIVQSLNGNGYANAVRQLRESLEALSVMIAEHLSTNAACIATQE